MSKKSNEVLIKIEGEEWTSAIDKAFEKKSKDVKIDGFRKGKAPKTVFIKKFGIESLYNDAIENVLDEAYKRGLKEFDEEIVCQPGLEIVEINENSVTIKFVFTGKPEITISKYKGLKVKKGDTKVTKEEVEHVIEDLKLKFADLTVKEGKVGNGDTAIINFEGFKDGVAFEGGKGDNYPLEIGSNTFIPGFEEQLIGMSAGEEKDINVTFPEDYASEELKGQPAVFKVKVNEVKCKNIPELNEDFFEDLAMEGVNSKETLEKAMEEDLQARKEMEVENKFIDDLLVAVAKNTKCDLPEEMVHEEIHRMLHQYEEQLKMQGITLEQFLQFTNSTIDALETQMKDEAEKRVLYRLIIEEIALLEKVEISDEEAEGDAETAAKKYNVSKEEFIKAIGGIEMLKYDLKMRKTIEVLKENN